MTFLMENLERLTLTEMEEFVRSNRSVKIDAASDSDYALIEHVLCAQVYRRLKKRAKGTVRRFLSKVTGFSRAQVTRLIGRWQQTRRVQRKPAQHPHFPRRYSAEDAALLAAADAAHEELSGPAVRHILQREFAVYGRPEYERLAEISVSHIYNLRRSAAYRKVRMRVEHSARVRCQSPNGAGRIPRANPAICASTRCIKDITTASPVCITLMRWIR